MGWRLNNCAEEELIRVGKELAVSVPQVFHDDCEKLAHRMDLPAVTWPICPRHRYPYYLVIPGHKTFQLFGGLLEGFILSLGSLVKSFPELLNFVPSEDEMQINPAAPSQ